MPNNELTFEKIREAVASASAAALTAAAKDISWIMEHADDQHSLDHWVGECLKIGATAKKRSVEYTLATRQQREQAKTAAQNMENFAKHLLMNPKLLTDARSGNISELLKVAGAFQIPVNVVLQYIAPQSAAPAQAAQAAGK